MFTNNVEVLNMARAMAVHASARQGVSARNMANADTPGYRARSLPGFAEVWRGRDFTLRETRAAHAGGSRTLNIATERIDRHGNPNGNSVSLEAEMVAAAEARQQHDMALAIYRSLSGSIRATLSRR